MGLMFGKYVIGFENSRGEVQYFMSFSSNKSYIYTTKDIDNAEKFMSENAARDFYYRKLQYTPVFDFDVKNAYVYKKSNFIARDPMWEICFTFHKLIT